MKILLVSLSNHYTFQETIYTLKEEMSKSTNFEVHTLGSNKMRYTLQKYDSRTNHIFNVPSKTGISIKMLDYFELSRIISNIKKIDPDYIMFFSSHIWNIPIMKKFKGKNIHIIHDVIPHVGDKNYTSVKMYNKYMSRISDFIVVHTRIFINLFSQMYKYPLEKIFYFNLTRKQIDYSSYNESNKILFFGRINKYKGIDFLIDIIPHLNDYQFIVAGKPNKDSYDEINILKAFPNVTIIDSYIDEKMMEKLFLESELVILPYKSATQSGVIIDAYKYSRPVVCFAVGGLVEQVNNETGFLIEDGNKEMFINKIRYYMSLAREEKETYAHSAYNFGLKKYSLESNVSLISNILMDIQIQQNGIKL
ncbi:MAG: glycosyltransferase [Acholeplasma sp.]|nr:glycosyltransferase [Acholeplasma sp.]